MANRSPLAAYRAVVHRLNSILAQQEALQRSVGDLNARLDALAAEIGASRIPAEVLARQMQVLRAIYDEEPGNRRRLWALRESPEYERPFEEKNPLVTVHVTTYSNAEGLATRSIPSILAQSYENLDVIVVGDAATPDVEEAARSFDDPRLRFVNLTVRGPYPSDPIDMWHVAGTAPANEGLRLARGQWIAMNCDDDAFTPNHVELLLAEARRRRFELVYGKIRRIDPDGQTILIGEFPPEAPGQFGVQAALMHRGLRMFPYELLDAVFGDPGDWAWVRRMVRLGVRMGMIDDVVVDYFPSQLWGTPARPPGLLTRSPNEVAPWHSA
jgi:hypothetical protein